MFLASEQLCIMHDSVVEQLFAFSWAEEEYFNSIAPNFTTHAQRLHYNGQTFCLTGRRTYFVMNDFNQRVYLFRFNLSGRTFSALKYLHCSIIALSFSLILFSVQLRFLVLIICNVFKSQRQPSRSH